MKLSINTVNAIDIPPRENVTYSKETQTPATDVVIDKDAKPLDYYGKLFHFICFFFHFGLAFNCISILVLTFDNDDDETASLDASSSTGGGGVSTQTNHHQHHQKSKSGNKQPNNQHKYDTSLNDH